MSYRAQKRSGRCQIHSIVRRCFMLKLELHKFLYCFLFMEAFRNRIAVHSYDRASSNSGSGLWLLIFEQIWPDALLLVRFIAIASIPGALLPLAPAALERMFWTSTIHIESAPWLALLRTLTVYHRHINPHSDVCHFHWKIFNWKRYSSHPNYPLSFTSLVTDQQKPPIPKYPSADHLSCSCLSPNYYLDPLYTLLLSIKLLEGFSTVSTDPTRSYWRLPHSFNAIPLCLNCTYNVSCARGSNHKS